MNNWQKELQSMKLSKQQKQKMKHAVYNKPAVREKPHLVWIVAPLFVMLLSFFVVLMMKDVPSWPLHQAAAPPNEVLETDHTQYFDLHLSLSLAAGFGLLLNSILLLVVVMKTKRWQQPRVQKARKLIHQWRYLLMLVTPFFLALATIGAARLPSTQAKVIAIYFMLMLFAFLMVLFVARHQIQTACCPHCQHGFSVKEKRRLMLVFRLELRCPQCGGTLYYAKKTRQASGVMSIVFLALLMLPANFGVPLWLALGGGVFMYVLAFYYLWPLFLALEGEEEPLF